MVLKVKGVPLPEITWYRDGVVIKPDERHVITADNEGNASLVILDATPEDDAEYLVKATNPSGVAQSIADVYVLDGKETHCL